MQGGDLYGLGIGVDATHLRAEVVGAVGLVHEPLETAADCRGRVTGTRQFGREDLGNVIEVRELPLAGEVRKQVLHQAALGTHVVVPGENRTIREEVRPASAQLLQRGNARCGSGGVGIQRCGCLVEEHTEPGGAHQGRIRRALERSEEHAPLLRGGGCEHAAGPRTDDGNPSPVERAHDLLGVGVRRHEYRNVARGDPPGRCALAIVLVLEEFDHRAGEVTEDRAARPRRRDLGTQRDVLRQP